MRISFLAATVLSVAGVTCIAAQDFDLARFRMCARLSEEQLCTGDLDVLRSTLNMVAKCNNLNHSLYVANECAQDSKSGLYCGAVYAYTKDIAALYEITCRSTIAGDNCTSECRNGLTDIRGVLGCCINAIVNNTDSIYGFASSAFTYDLWSRCGVVPPNSTCSGTLNFTLTDSQQPSCIKAPPLGCSQSIQDAIVDSIQGLSNCDNILQYQMDYCSQRENGDYCSATIDKDVTTFAFPALTACSAALSNQICPDNCKVLLE